MAHLWPWELGHADGEGWFPRAEEGPGGPRKESVSVLWSFKTITDPVARTTISAAAMIIGSLRGGYSV